MPDADRLQELFERALELAPAARAEFLQRECAGDPALQAEVRALLESDAVAAQNPSWQMPAIHIEASQQTPVEDEHLGEAIGPYRIVALIGRGGAGKVYRAVRSDAEFERSVAIKLIRGGDDAAEIVSRFRLERQILANLEHPNIARLLDGGTTARGLPYLVMEYIEGEPLDAWCARRQPGIAERLRIFRQVCAAVHYAHQRMVIHRDLKPGNILVTADGTPKLVDFGISKLLEEAQTGPAPVTMTGMRPMTPRYASPEQVRGETVTAASDIYSLGVVLYELLSGRSPYDVEGTSTHQLMRAVCEQEPRKPGVVARKPLGDLDNIVLMALRKDPTRRYASVDQFAEDIRRYQEGYPVLARPDTRRYRAARFVRRNKFGVAAGAALFLALVGGIAATAREAHVANQRFRDVRRFAHSMIFEYHDAIALLPGSVGVRSRLVKDGLEYLDRLSAQTGRDDDLKKELADAYLKVGDVQAGVLHANLGDVRGGLGSYRKAIRLLEDLDRRNGGEEIQEELSAAYRAYGQLNQVAGDPRAAVDSLTKAVALIEKMCAAGHYRTLAKITSEAVYAGAAQDRRVTLATLYLVLGRAEGDPGVPNMGNPQAAERWYRKALNTYGSVAPDKTVLTSTAAVHAYLASLMTTRGDMQGALTESRKALAIDVEIAQMPPFSPQFQRELPIAYHNVGAALLATHDFAGALEEFRQAGAILEKMVASDPANEDIKTILATNIRRTADAEYGLSNFGAAVKDYSRAIRNYEQQAERDQANAALGVRLGTAYVGLSTVLAKLRDGSGTLQAAGRAVKLLEPLAAANPNARQTLAQACFESGEGYSMSGEWLQARDWFRRSFDLWQEVEAKGQLFAANSAKPAQAEQALDETRRHLPSASR